MTLREECRGSGVQISVLCPPPTMTNPDILKRMKHQGGRAKIVSYTAEEVAASAIRNMYKKRVVIVPGKFMHFLIMFSWIVPYPVKLRILGRIYARDAIRYTPEEKKINVPTNSL